MEFIDLKRQQRRIKSELDRRIQKVLSHGQYIMGPEVEELEGCLSSFVGVKHCIGVANGTDALLIAMMAAGVGRGGEVITSPFAFIAIVEMIILLGAKPIFVDIDPDTYNMDPNKIANAITAKTRAIIPVSLYGQCADFNEIEKEINLVSNLRDSDPIIIIEDAAQSFGATYKGRRSCGLSTIACTSFFPSKPLGCYGDGGACFTDDDTFSIRMRQIRIHGQDRRYHHPIIGLNGRLDTLQAAVVLAKMTVFEDEVNRRIQIGTQYTELLKDYVKTPAVKKDHTHVYAQYTVEVDNREQFIAKLSNPDQKPIIPIAIHYPVPLHLQPCMSQYGYQKGDFPVSELAAERVISLPMHPYLTDQEMEYVVNAVRGTTNWDKN